MLALTFVLSVVILEHVLHSCIHYSHASRACILCLMLALLEHVLTVACYFSESGNSQDPLCALESTVATPLKGVGHDMRPDCYYIYQRRLGLLIGSRCMGTGKEIRGAHWTQQNTLRRHGKQTAYHVAFPSVYV